MYVDAMDGLVDGLCFDEPLACMNKNEMLANKYFIFFDMGNTN